MTDSPLIYTSHGNLPVSELTHGVEWRVSDTQIIFVEKYLLGDEIVRQSSHVKVLTGVSLSGEANS